MWQGKWKLWAKKVQVARLQAAESVLCNSIFLESCYFIYAGMLFDLFCFEKLIEKISQPLWRGEAGSEQTVGTGISQVTQLG